MTVYDETFYLALKRLGEEREKNQRQKVRPCAECKCNDYCSGKCDKWAEWFEYAWDKMRTVAQKKWGYYIDRGGGG